MANRVTELFGIRYPIIQAGMVWASGWRLASAVSNAGGLGLIGAGSMYPEVLSEHIQKCKKATSKPFGVNVPLLYPEIDLLMEVIIQENVPIVFTAAGNPKLWTAHLKSKGCIVVHVVSSVKFALKAQACGVDAIVAEGFEAVLDYAIMYETKKADRSSAGRFSSKLVAMEWANIWVIIAKKGKSKEWCTALYYGAKKEFGNSNGPFLKIY